MIHKLPDNVVEYFEDSGMLCAICGEPFMVKAKYWTEYDCVWADELNGVMHEGCAEGKIAYLENEGSCQVCVKNGTTNCPATITATSSCFESRYK